MIDIVLYMVGLILFFIYLFWVMCRSVRRE